MILDTDRPNGLKLMSDAWWHWQWWMDKVTTNIAHSVRVTSCYIALHYSQLVLLSSNPSILVSSSVLCLMPMSYHCHSQQSYHRTTWSPRPCVRKLTSLLIKIIPQIEYVRVARMVSSARHINNLESVKRRMAQTGAWLELPLEGSMADYSVIKRLKWQTLR